MLVVFNNKNYICLIDYAFGNLHWLEGPEDGEQKKEIEKEILRKTDSSFINNIKNIEEVKINNNINNLLNDIKNNSIYKKYQVEIDSLNKQENVEEKNE